MKKMISGLFVLLLMSMSVLASAEAIQTKKVLPNGDVVLITPTPTGQKVSPEAMSYLWSAGRVLSGEEVPVYVTRDLKMVGWLHYYIVTTYDKVVALDDSGQNMVIKKVPTTVKKGEVQVAWFIAFFILSVVAMVIFDYGYMNRITFLITYPTSILSMLPFTFFFTIFLNILTLMSFVAFCLNASVFFSILFCRNERWVKRYIILFYLLMGSLLLMIYTS